MDFKIVEIPTAQILPGAADPLLEALKANPGKAIEIPLGEKDPNTQRKTIRARLSNRGVLKTHFFRTRFSMESKSLIVWLEEKKPATAVASIDQPDGNKA